MLRDDRLGVDVSSKDRHDKGHDKGRDGHKKLKTKFYEKELFKLQIELCKLQEWVKESGTKTIVVSEEQQRRFLSRMTYSTKHKYDDQALLVGQNFVPERY